MQRQNFCSPWSEFRRLTANAIAQRRSMPRKMDTQAHRLYFLPWKYGFDYVTSRNFFQNIDLLKKNYHTNCHYRSQRRSAADGLLGLRVRVQPGECMSVFFILCCHVQVSVTGRSLVQRILTKSGVSECDRETSGRHTTAFELWTKRLTINP